MHLPALLISLATALQLALAATPPQFFELKTKVLTSSSTTNKGPYNGLFATLEGDTKLAPIFAGLNSDALVFASQMQTAATTKTPALYSIFFNETSTAGHFLAQMGFGIEQFTNWLPVTFVHSTSSKTAGNPLYENRFYFNSTGSAMTLEWSNGKAKDQDYTAFEGWLVCDWWYGAPQLFFTTDFQSGKLPSTCAEIELAVIPVPN